MQVNEKKEVLICKVNKGAVEDSFGIWRVEKSGIVYVDEMRDYATLKRSYLYTFFTIVISGKNGRSSD